MFGVIIVTDKANHALHYKESATATAAFNKFLRERKDLANAGASDYASIEIEDDYGVKCSPRLSSIVTVQISSIEADHEVERDRQFLKMRSDLKYGEMIASDPVLRDAQAKAAAKSRLVGGN